MAKDTIGYLSKKKAEAPNAEVSQMWTELEDLHSKRYVAVSYILRWALIGII